MYLIILLIHFYFFLISIFFNIFNFFYTPHSAFSEQPLAKPLDVIVCYLYKLKWSNLIGLLCVARTCDWLRKITPLSNLTQTASRGMKSYGESRIELRNLQIIKKNAGKTISVFVIREALWAEKLGCCIALHIAGVERICSENLMLRSTLDDIWFQFRVKERYRRCKFVPYVVGDSQISLT